MYQPFQLLFCFLTDLILFNPHVATLSGLLSRAIESRRKYLTECGQDGENEEDWDEWN